MLTEIAERTKIAASSAYDDAQRFRLDIMTDC